MSSSTGIIGSVDPIGVVPNPITIPGGTSYSLQISLSSVPQSDTFLSIYVLPATTVAPGSIQASNVSVQNHDVEVQVHTIANPSSGNASAPGTQQTVQIGPGNPIHSVSAVAPNVTAETRYIITVLGHDSNGNPTQGVSTTITVTP